MATPPSHSPSLFSSSLRVASDQSEADRLRGELERVKAEFEALRSDYFEAVQQAEGKEAQRADAEQRASSERSRRLKTEDELQAAREALGALQKSAELAEARSDALLAEERRNTERARRGHGLVADEQNFLRSLFQALQRIQRHPDCEKSKALRPTVAQVVKQVKRRGVSVTLGYDLEADED